MKPILFQIGPFPISSFGLFLLLAFVVSIALARRRAAPLGIDPSQMLDIALYMIIGGIVVGRLGYVVANLPTIAHEPAPTVTIRDDSGQIASRPTGVCALAGEIANTEPRPPTTVRSE